MSDASTSSSVKIAPAPVELERVDYVTDKKSLGWISDRIANVIEGPTPKWWWASMAIALPLLLLLPCSILYLMSTGVGVWGLNHPVMWGWAIVNFVWWIGIGHAGTLISAILFLLRQKWRTSINRASEAMTIFAVMCAGVFPLIHIGRIWYGWWLFPIPNANDIWPQFRSPLMWDVFAVSTYFTVSLLFWMMGLVPDMAVMRDRAKTKLGKLFYGFFSLGWMGGNRQWRNYEKAYLLLAGLSTPLVLSVHSIVSLDFAVSNLPGWHTTIFPPYFVAGAVFSGFGMVLTLLIPLRSLLKLEKIITVRHVELMCQVTLAVGSIVGYAYFMEVFIAWYGGNPYERDAFWYRAFGPYWWGYWLMIGCNVIVPQLFWSKKIRQNMLLVFFLSILVNVGMWFERFEIVITTLAREMMPANWGYFSPTVTDVTTYLGTFGLFFTLFLLFLRFLPMIAITEVKGVTPQADPHHPLGGAKEDH
ncbi:polysulfide reductase NrfD [Verrucomicrobia bacterium]|nr:polysulfide reductase NrfD [Verrucomicrobiota bacterium]